ncbi:hypothetical protein NPIL_53821 [Nephila pilipes]|uniref:Uncharacterized protein n=1 Tax=Nephila pilipes TaxID=299642 RepID=A0A8X6PE96_NEPPI|nr:hypothetical protein NPIL_53821 [Nephila pilipes]
MNILTMFSAHLTGMNPTLHTTKREPISALRHRPDRKKEGLAFCGRSILGQYCEHRTIMYREPLSTGSRPPEAE